jgi:hypothetical protein
MLVHGDNLRTKLNHQRKYLDARSRASLAEIEERYGRWEEANRSLKGPTATVDARDAEVLEARTELLRNYKTFLDQKKYAEMFDARSNLHSSVLEEFLYYLFRDLVASFGEHALIGKSHTFKDLFFVPPSYAAMLERPHARVERKDHDFVIGAAVTATFRSRPPAQDDSQDGTSGSVSEGGGVSATASAVEPGVHATGREGVASDAEAEMLTFDVPAVAIECKTYLDKTMLEGSSRAAEEIKARNPNGLYLVLCERLKLSGAVNLRKYSVDQIYVLRKERNVDREFRLLDSYAGNPIADEVVVHLFNAVRDALITDWSVGLDAGIERGWLL